MFFVVSGFFFFLPAAFILLHRNYFFRWRNFTVNITLKRRSRSPSPVVENGQKSLAPSESLDSRLAMSTTTTSAASTVTSPAQVRTLFVSGLPMDAKPRELYLLFRAYPGYESSLLKITSKNGKTATPVGFVTFSSKLAADEARKALQGVRFDPDSTQTIRLELARSNTKVSKPKRITPPPPIMHNPTGLQAAAMFQNAAVAAAAQPNHFLASLSTSHAHDLANAATAACFEPNLSSIFPEHQLFTLSSLSQLTQPHVIFPSNSTVLPQVSTNPAAAAAAAAIFQPNAAILAQLTAAQLNAASQAAAASQAVAVATAPPGCSTLFVANLGSSVTEEELKQVSIFFYIFLK